MLTSQYEVRFVHCLFNTTTAQRRVFDFLLLFVVFTYSLILLLSLLPLSTGQRVLVTTRLKN